MSEAKPKKRPPSLRRLIESKEPERRTADEYRDKVRHHYDGVAGWFTVVSGAFTGHETLAGKLIGPHGFDIRGCKRILDAGCGNGRYLRFLLRRADPDAELTGFDLSAGMLRRAGRRLKSRRPALVAADLTRLPYRDQAFDAIVCGWVLEHLPDPRPGLSELHRVLKPGGKLLLLTSETNLLGAVCSRFYHCRTYRRDELRSACHECGLEWKKDHWWSGFHKLFRLGGIVVEMRRVGQSRHGSGNQPPGIAS